ncbi:MAG: hypothetical protein HC882_09005 [Acidobacteria bacterium]|nr:hypothetical protein [Acidobacteriota bacterium]
MGVAVDLDTEAAVIGTALRGQGELHRVADDRKRPERAAGAKGSVFAIDVAVAAVGVLDDEFVAGGEIEPSDAHGDVRGAWVVDHVRPRAVVGVWGRDRRCDLVGDADRPGASAQGKGKRKRKQE